MKHFRNLALAIIAILFVISVGKAQTQKFDVMTFTPPKGWTQQQNSNAKVFTTVNKSTNKFCLMMIYPSIDSNGNASDDFKYVWKKLVQDAFKAGGNPEKESAKLKEFTMTQGGELINYEGSQALAMLTTLSGKGRIISILTIMNDAQFTNDIQAFLDGMKFDIKENPKVDKEKINADSSGSTKVSSLKKDILGEWYLSDGNIKITLMLAVNGHFGRSFTSTAARPIALNLYQTTTYKGDGTYTLNNNTLKIIPRSGSAEIYQVRVTFEKNSDGKVEKKLYLLRPVEGGKLYESEYWFVK